MQIQLRAQVSLHWRRWDDEFVVYDEASGRTHQLDALNACVLLSLEEGSLDDARLADMVAAELGCAPEALSGALPGVIEQLLRADLIETCAP